MPALNADTAHAPALFEAAFAAMALLAASAVALSVTMARSDRREVRHA